MSFLIKCKYLTLFTAAALAGLLLSSCDNSRPSRASRELAHEILAEAIAIRSVDDGSGSSVTMAEAMAKRLIDAGFAPKDVLVTGPRPEVGVVIARYKGDGSGGKPIVVMAHMDVVDAKPSDWNRNPFELQEDDTYFYGRGVGDNKGGVVTLVATFIRLREEGYVPNRDIVMMLTGDEETTGDSANWLANQRRDLIDADLALNTDAGGGWIEGGKDLAFIVQTSEKMYLSFEFTVRNSGGHSSVPRPDNAIYQLMHGLANLEAYRFPVTVNDSTRTSFGESAKLLEGPIAADLAAVADGSAGDETYARLSQDPYWNAMLRTTCVATMLNAGHAENALPQSATATVNCRIFPGGDADQVEATLRQVMAVDGLEAVRLNVPRPSEPSPLAAEIMGPVDALVKKHFGDLPVIPDMSTGATDGLYLRNVGIPVYGISALFAEEGEENAHGMDEKIRKKSFYEALEYWHDLLKALTGGKV